MNPSTAKASNIKVTDFHCLYDISWTLHRLQWPTLSNRPNSLLSSSRSRANRAKQLQEFLQVELVGPEADSTFDEKAGKIQKCSWQLLEAADREHGAIPLDASGMRISEERGSGILITFRYDAAKYTAILFGPVEMSPNTTSSSDCQQQQSNPLPLLLTKTPMVLTKRLFTFLLDTFDLRIAPLKLTGSLLTSSLEAYVDILYRSIASKPPAAKKDFIVSSLKDLKVSLAFGVPVAPHLRTIDVDVPAETLCSLIETSGSAKVSLMRVLATHLEHHTGMILPLSSSDNTYAEESEHLVRVSKIVCHAFALSGDGRFKIVEQAMNAAQVQNLGFVFREANQMILRSLLVESAKSAG